MSKFEFSKKRTCRTGAWGIPSAVAALSLLTGIFFLPLALWGAAAPERLVAQAEEAPPSAVSLPPTQAQTAAGGEGAPLRVILADGTVAVMSLEDYLFGVVAAEMPARFPVEALKAQAVAARTYTLKKRAAARSGESDRHPQGDVCVSSSCCQAYLSPDAAAEKWGAEAEAYKKKLQGALEDTAGLVLCRDGALIDAVFHASSSGATADAQAVWGTAVPYLVSVDTPETAETVPDLESTVTLSPADFAAQFSTAYPAADLSGPPESWFSALERTTWGGVSSVTVGGVAVTGGALRQLFSLRSTRFTVQSDGDAVTFQVTAYGHGVGMSQQGARLLAEGGADFSAILRHYYTGVTLQPFSSLPG